MSTEAPPALESLDDGLDNMKQLPNDIGRAHPGGINEATITKKGTASHGGQESGTLRAICQNYAHHVRMRASDKRIRCAVDEAGTSVA